MGMIAIDAAGIAAIIPLGTVLGFAALLLKRWWTQQDNAMAAAIDASNKEGVKCDERIAALRAEYGVEIQQLRDDFNRLQMVVRDLIPNQPADVQARLWEVMWSTKSGPPPSVPALPPSGGNSASS